MAAEFFDKHFFSSPKAALQRAVAQALFVAFDGPVEGPTLTEYNGYRCYVVTRDVGGNPQVIYNWVFIMVSLPAGALMSAQDFLQDEHQLLANCNYGITGEVAGPTWTQYVEAFTEIMGDVLTEFIETVCEAFISIGEGSALTMAGDECGVLGIPVTVLIDSNVIVIQLTLYGCRKPVVPLYSAVTFAWNPGQSRQNVINATMTGSLARIEAALEDIALQEYEIALNNGQSIFRVRGRSTITGPGGEG